MIEDCDQIVDVYTYVIFLYEIDKKKWNLNKNTFYHKMILEIYFLFCIMHIFCILYMFLAYFTMARSYNNRKVLLKLIFKF